MSHGSFFKILLLIALSIVMLVVATAFSLAYGSNAEGRFFPVITDGVVTILKEDHREITMVAGGNKRRPCEYLGTHAMVMKGGEWFKADFNIAPRFLTTTRTGVQTFGIYHLMDRNWERVSLTSIHRCHSLWLTMTTWVDVARADIKKTP